jgi:hypothetical protein
MNALDLSAHRFAFMRHIVDRSGSGRTNTRVWNRSKIQEARPLALLPIDDSRLSQALMGC